tara:strand:- start:65696 stop:70057 length:4362 start_codon:yes stop_codon:yes gene_type:complete
MLILWVLIVPVHADTILAIVSPRNVSELVSGAHDYLKDKPSEQINIRTTEQWSALSPQQQNTLLTSADLVFSGGVFGDSAELLNNALSQGIINNFIAVHSDRRLVSASKVHGKSLLLNADIDSLMENPDPTQAPELWVNERLALFPQYHDWLLTRLFWLGRNSSNMLGLFDQLGHVLNSDKTTYTPQLVSPLRGYYLEHIVSLAQFDFSQKKSWVVLLDYETGDRHGEKKLLDSLCIGIESDNIGCMAVLAGWGKASVDAVEVLASNNKKISLIISLQNFVVGAGEGREQVNQYLSDLNVPVLKGIRLSDTTEDEWLLSEEGLGWNSVHYLVAMPELQGISQAMVVAAMSKSTMDTLTGAEMTLTLPIDKQVALMTQRANRWLVLQQKKNKDKKVAIIYYNHPPGRHNIGADNLNVPESLFDMLVALKAAGYQTGELPSSSEALLDMLQEKGVNLPEDGPALKAMSSKVQLVSKAEYLKWFADFPVGVQQEMVNGPLGYLHIMLQRAVNLEDKTIGHHLMERVIKDLHHALDGVEHPARNRALNLLEQLEVMYSDPTKVDWDKAKVLVDAIANQGIEGIRGWGPAPGYVMVHDDQLVLPGMQFGNVFIGPQPPRGWEINEELLHANLSFPPPHQYLAFYQWLRKGFKADALIHLGRHSTYEFLPRHRVGMSDEDYPSLVLGDLPSIYPYIVDGVGEGIQAKRRGLAVMIDHLTPPLESTALYDDLLSLRQVVESFESAPVNAKAIRHRAIDEIKKLVGELNLQEELQTSMASELAVRGVTDFYQVDDELLVHEVGHYLTKLQEDFMPLGLHVFGRDWSADAIDTMVKSMSQNQTLDKHWYQLLATSPKAEMEALLGALNGQYVDVGKGNDPIRTPEVLPTGRNFYAMDGSLIPSRLGYNVGIELASKARIEASLETNIESSQNNSLSKPISDELEGSDAIVLWASDVVRDEGAMIAFGFDMLGVKPVWNSRGIFKGLERFDVSQFPDLDLQGKPISRVRHDALFTTSGLFRDLYGAQLVWLERAVLLALDGSSDLIRQQYPALTYALNSALKPLAGITDPGTESLAVNRVAARWVKDASAALNAGMNAEQAGREASYRIFGTTPGTYGAGVNRLVERSGAWQDRSQLAQTYISRMGHAYGNGVQGEPNQNLFKQRLATVDNTYLGRASNLYGLLDNNDSFDYLGGLSLAVETVQDGVVPNNFILSYADSNNMKIEPLDIALLSELRGRYLNPQWLEPLMDEGYAGARTMGSEFLEYLWGWQVTNPGVVKSWVWDEVKAVYIDDKLELGLDTFLQEGHNVHVKSNMLAVMLVAAQKGFWDADEEEIKQLAEAFTALVLEHGLPGSGHTNPDNPIYPWLATYVDDASYQTLAALLQATKISSEVVTSPSTIVEINLKEQQVEAKPQQQAEDKTHQETKTDYKSDYILLFAAILLLIIGGFRGLAMPKSDVQKRRR